MTEMFWDQTAIGFFSQTTRFKLLTFLFYQDMLATVQNSKGIGYELNRQKDWLKVCRGVDTIVIRVRKLKTLKYLDLFGLDL